MKCPMRTKVEGFKGRIEEYSFGDCSQSECAWWDNTVNCCIAITIGDALDGIMLSLNRIAEKMPHEAQFRK